MIDKSAITMHPLSEYLTEYKELNVDNLYRPVAVGRYGIRTRESIYSKELAADYSNAPEYPTTAKLALKEMVRQTGDCVFDRDGYMIRGTMVRHLILPGHTKNAIKVMEYLKKTYGDHIFISIMNQYTPVFKQEKYKELNRKVTVREYEKVLNAALELGISNGFFQEGDTAKESFIPDFDYEGV